MCALTPFAPHTVSENRLSDAKTYGKSLIILSISTLTRSAKVELHKLGLIALDVICSPLREVTAERLFSHLNFVNRQQASLTFEN